MLIRRTRSKLTEPHTPTTRAPDEQTGWLHALISTPLAFYCIMNPSPALVADPIFNYASKEAAVFAFSGGYFAYDLLVSLWEVKSHGVPFVVHAASCCFIFFKVGLPSPNSLELHGELTAFATGLHADSDGRRTHIPCRESLSFAHTSSS